ncbi:hypothetical protein BDV98DRAFT_557510 [Pterulicium gracile]|uniref:Uncharacterized protein n=1 Tax=Pterulicium gracile TaxID=1884261 RepID=A0A5C3QYZ8_9AGAR|nr:hypothetical protein BDV98DRAFT_557510 [Pterula gracilis]
MPVKRSSRVSASRTCVVKAMQHQIFLFLSSFASSSHRHDADVVAMPSGFELQASRPLNIAMKLVHHQAVDRIHISPRFFPLLSSPRQFKLWVVYLEAVCCLYIV